tara:strand:- start:267 stop:425 length:159 start_codon:yes stop_codon:yes gene_type:complete
MLAQRDSFVWLGKAEQRVQKKRFRGVLMAPHRSRLKALVTLAMVVGLAAASA